MGRAERVVRCGVLIGATGLEGFQKRVGHERRTIGVPSRGSSASGIDRKETPPMAGLIRRRPIGPTFRAHLRPRCSMTIRVNEHHARSIIGARARTRSFQVEMFACEHGALNLPCIGL